MPDLALDPFTLAYRAIWDALLSDDGFTALVRPGNRNDLSAPQFSRVKDQAQWGDLPEATLLQTAFAMSLSGHNSLTFAAEQTYPLVIASDSLKVVQLNAVKWRVYLALLARPLEDVARFAGVPFVDSWTVTNGGDGTGQVNLTTTAQRGTDRMSAILNINVRMYFSRSLLASLPIFAG